METQPEPENHGVVDVTSQTQVPSDRPTRSPWPIVVAVLLTAVVILQLAILSQVGRSNDDLTTLSGALANVDDRLGDLELAAASASASPASGLAATAVPPGSLPEYTDAQPDPAVAQGYVLGDVTALSYYDGVEVGYRPTDGRARVWVIWAHWCPYCQQELPELSAWWAANADRYVNTDLITVSTSHDPTRGNPLGPYLDESQFPFPVLIDSDLTLAQQFGTSAFPYWVVTGPDGKVLLRLAGQIGTETAERIFGEVEALVAA